MTRIPRAKHDNRKSTQRISCIKIHAKRSESSSDKTSKRCIPSLFHSMAQHQRWSLVRSLPFLFVYVRSVGGVDVDVDTLVVFGDGT